MMKILRGAAVLTCTLTIAGCSAAQPLWDDPVAPYAQRKQGVTLSAGNAHDANAVTHMDDPWPRYVRKRKIAANGERMVGAVERYRDVSKLSRAPPPIVPVYGTTVGVSGATTGGGGGGGGGGTSGR